jgi:hypothetical protein
VLSVACAGGSEFGRWCCGRHEALGFPGSAPTEGHQVGALQHTRLGAPSRAARIIAQDALPHHTCRAEKNDFHLDNRSVNPARSFQPYATSLRAPSGRASSRSATT